MNRKGFVFMFALVLTVSMLVACVPINSGVGGTQGTVSTETAGPTSSATAPTIPNFNPTGYPIVNERIVIKAMNRVVANGGPYGDDMSFFRAMKELTNIDFEFSNTPATEWDTKMGLSLASNDLPDVYLFDITAANIVNYGVKGGLLVDWSDMIDDYMPNLLSWTEEIPNLFKYVTEINGAIYSFPRYIGAPGDNAVTMSVRLDYMHAAGIQNEPETIDEFYEMLKAIQAANANKDEFYPFLDQISARTAYERYIFSALGDYTDSYFNDDGTGKVVFSGVTDQLYRYLEFTHKLFEEKLICNEIYTMDAATRTALTKANKVAVAMSFTMLDTSNFESGKVDFTILSPLTSQYTSVKKSRDLPGIQSTGNVITTKCKNVEALLRWFDICYAKEDVIPGLDHFSPWVGIRGETWDYTDDTKKYYEFKMPTDWTLSTTEFIYTKCGPSHVYMGTMNAIPVGSSPGLEIKVNHSRDKVMPYMVPNFPFDYLKYTNEDMDEFTAIWTDMNKYITQMKAKFIIGEEPLSNFSQYVETLNKMGLPRVLELVQKAYDRFNGK